MNHAFRISINENVDSKAYLLYGINNNQLHWSDAYLLTGMHTSCALEISSRGIRMIHECDSSYYKHINPEKCNPVSHGLCQLTHGLILPHQEDGRVRVSGHMQNTFESDILTSLSRQSMDSCGDFRYGRSGTGEGRTLFMNESVYDVSACDVLHGNYILLYDIVNASLYNFHSPFGPMAYVIVMFISLVCLYGVCTEANDNSHYAIYCLSCMLLCVGCFCSHVFHQRYVFLTFEDELYFICSFVFCICYGIISLYKSSHLREACIYGLSCICTAMYRSPENPYVYIFITLIMMDIWTKVMKSNFYPAAQLDLCVSALFACLTCEFGLRPLFQEEYEFIIYIGIGIYCTLILQVSILNKRIN